MLHSNEKSTVLLHTTTVTNLTGTVKSPRSQAEKTTYCYDSIYVKFKNRQNESVVTEVRIVVTSGIGAGEDSS